MAGAGSGGDARMTPERLPLRDVHLPDAPGLWPLAPGWWLVLAGLVVLLGVAVALRWRRQRRRARWLRLFESTVQAAGTPAARVAAMSELLRRAAREVDAAAVQLQGEPWLRFLDGDQGSEFSQGPGRILLDGGFRRSVEASEVERVLPLARRRFLELMAGGR